ncbi:hypothetical protein TWF481_008714 [Arthrobotrys musiformis]|uniref:DUF4246 domain-containing protein n=1 Tax=Arthrobotrys musiformis TaxID=47236 RepID=A0AAV9WAD5_9PEZI
MQMYPHPLDSSWNPRQLTCPKPHYRNFITAALNKPDWVSQAADKSTVVKWFREAEEHENRYAAPGGGYRLTWNESDIQYAWRELTNYRKYIEGLRAEGSRVEPDIRGIWKADGIVSEELRGRLVEAADTLGEILRSRADAKEKARLERMEKQSRRYEAIYIPIWDSDTPESEDEADTSNGESNPYIDYMPSPEIYRNSSAEFFKKQIVNLIDPSLWPVVYGKTKKIIDAQPVEVPAKLQSERSTRLWPGHSDKFCCLPSEFRVSADGNKTKILSYINNLPSLLKNRSELYTALEDAFTALVPLFNHVLADLSRPQPEGPPTIDLKSRERERLLEEERLDFIFGRREDGVHKVPDNPKQLGEILDSFEHGEEPKVIKYTKGHCTDHLQCQEKEKRCQKICHLETVSKSSVWTPPQISDGVKVEGRDWKVFVKLSNINLTPESPQTTIEEWHIDAGLNERIVATGIYCYDQENVTDLKLDFRLSFFHSVEEFLLKENRAVVFPNILERRTRSFQLIDGTKPGYRKMLTFFVCDPSEPYDIPTTRVIAPQQRGESKIWLIDQLRRGRLGSLPEEIFQQILERSINHIKHEVREGEAVPFSRRACFFGTSMWA